MVVSGLDPYWHRTIGPHHVNNICHIYWARKPHWKTGDRANWLYALRELRLNGANPERPPRAHPRKEVVYQDEKHKELPGKFLTKKIGLQSCMSQSVDPNVKIWWEAERRGRRHSWWWFTIWNDFDREFKHPAIIRQIVTSGTYAVYSFRSTIRSIAWTFRQFFPSTYR